MENLEWALECASRGWCVFPSREKKPLVRWSKYASKDEADVRSMWNLFPDGDVCIATGARSNLIVLDWDAYKQERPLFPLNGGIEPDTYMAKTHKGGYHWYFLHPGFQVRNSAGSLAPFIDVRGDGGMVVAYQNRVDLPLLEVPLSYVEVQNKQVDMSIDISTPAHEYRGFTQWAEHLKNAGLADLRFAKEGKRNATLYAVASDLYRLVWAGALDKDTVTQALGDQALAIGLEAHEIGATLASAMRNGATQHLKGAV